MRPYSSGSPPVRFVLGALGARRGQAGLCTRVRAAAVGQRRRLRPRERARRAEEGGERARALPPASSSVRPLPRLFLPGGPLPSSARSLRPAPSALPGLRRQRSERDGPGRRARGGGWDSDD